MSDGLAWATSLVDVLASRAQGQGGRGWLTLYERDKITATLTFGELYHASLSWAHRLAGEGVSPGDRVVLVLPTERAFYEAYWGILCAGAVPVPAYPPVRMGRIEEYYKNLAGQIKNCGASAVVTSDKVRPFVRPACDLAGLKLPLITEASGAALEKPAAPGPDGLALLQYTSGSTGSQKGVSLTHANLLANIRAFGSAVKLGESDVGVTWLPLYHDMGLIGLMLGSIYWGLPLVACSPVDFLRRPARWLKMISDHKGTVSAGPNFAFSLLARKVRDEELKGVDLSSWRVALCGAEPIHPSTVERFNQRFAGYGLSPTAFFPAYGLAENSLAVSFSTLGEPAKIMSFDQTLLETQGRAQPVPEGGRRLVSVGRPLDTVEMAVLDDEGYPLPQGRLGEICVRGPSVMAGYFQNPEATAKALAGGWLHTGDLGFSFGGEYFVSGRSKDMVIKAGRNYFAEDIEAAASTVKGVRPGGLCVFSVENAAKGVEDAVLVAETAEPRPGMEDEIRLAVSDATGLRPDVVVLLKPHTVPKTSSGKIQRFKAREWYLDGTLATREGERATTGLVTYAKAAIQDFFKGRSG